MADTYMVKHPIYFRGEALKPGETRAQRVPDDFLTLDYVEPAPKLVKRGK